MTKTRWKYSRSAVLVAITFTIPLDAVSLSQCSSQNTGLGDPAASSIYMTNGQCHDTCQGYAFAITQWQNCWCSNEAPGVTAGTGDCSQHCPGYPSEFCGNQQQGLYGYIALGKAAEGTMGAGGIGTSSAPPPVAPSSQPQTVVQISTQVQSAVLPPSPPPPPPPPPPPATTAPPVTVIQTQQNTETQVNIVPSTVPTTVQVEPSTTVLQGPTSTVSASISIITPTPIVVTSAQAVTVGGSVVTNYVTSVPSITPNPSLTYQMPKPSKTGLSAGAIAGIAVASILAAAAVIVGLIALLCWRQKRKEPHDNEGAPKRNASVLSRVGLLRNSNHSEDEQPVRAPTLPQIRTSGIAIIDNGPESALTMGSSQMGENRRLSRPLFSDNRLNPNALMTNPNISRTSVSTLQDNQDYSRPLEIRNPDR